MKTYSTRQAASKLGLSGVALAHYIKVKKVPAPQILNIGGRNIHAWTEAEIENVRKLLPKIANGRKTRYKKKQSALSNQQSVKTKAQPRAAVPHKSRKPKKK
jgi:predicted DNA-binding transcriptional regulator AlpA